MAEFKVVRAGDEEVEVSSGPLTRVAGISESLVGATGIHMAIGSVPPNSKSSPHTHVNCETALYVLRGHGRFLIGEGLKESIEVGPGDYIFVPPGALHQPINDHPTEVWEMIVCRNSPVEIVEEYVV
jgi:uncharacterized RmlC-like cupin family protein